MFMTTAQARRQMRALDLPKDLPKVLEKHRYRAENFIDLFIEECEAQAFHDSQAGFEMAKVAVRLVEESEGCRAHLKVRALSFLAGEHRKMRNFAAADRLYKRALALPIGKKSRAFLCCRISFLRSDQKRLAEAFALVEEALQLFEEVGEESHYGTALSTRATPISSPTSWMRLSTTFRSPSTSSIPRSMQSHTTVLCTIWPTSSASPPSCPKI